MRKKQSKGSGIRKFLIFAVIILAIASVASGIWLSNMWGQIYQVVMPEYNVVPHTEDDGGDIAIPEVMNLLLLGLDPRDHNMRSDTMMVMTLNRRSGEISLFSIPRDMRVMIPDHRQDKINHAFAYGGVALARKTVEDFLGINIDYYMTTDFDGFENIIEILGGIELDVEKRMYYKGIDVLIDLQPGLQHLDGDKALQYVRWRSDGEADFGRVRRQQQFLKALLQEMIAFKNIIKVPRLLPEIAANIKTDLELNQAILLANKLKGIDFEQINTFTLPGRPETISGIDYVIPLEREIGELVDQYMKGGQIELSKN
ncbi:MAG TPA: LCP family protein [Firmicutes bacterium]|nr:LCP family protein [Bacillota bacterium]